ncbi:ergothioneine biosynthesis glutamate--cysteine ligase EgtA [Phaeacidiphilus oryzae]|uniref:ergothioneine biosynthesis glutamate--cysteine ligase EgtA n=1 Tax=Phaeacidiphilus oryzae TaxID=348818 RepID=UPI00056198CF|nr:ergothioneine biosynthesis glutamate--cysteine ligase EgtA [Phaeacidiphilus oryzae]
MTLREEDAEAHVRGVCFKTGPPERVGVELEWLVHDRADPAAAVPAKRVDEALAGLEPRGLPGGGRLTREPGGQLELSSPPAPGPVAAVARAAADLAVLRRLMADAGLELSGQGLEPVRPVGPRVLDHPRYRAMEAYFDRSGPWGRMMMRGTASVQINLDAGDAGPGTTGYRDRWLLAHRIGPVLVAAFANSPLWQGRPTGWRSTRQAVWARLDPGRTLPAARHGRFADGGDPHDTDPDPGAEWARYVLDAHLLCLRGQERAPDLEWTAPPGLSFRDWLRGGVSAGNGSGRVGRPATLEDLDYHCSTLFPPVRPRGWLELRMVDAQQGDDWLAATAVAATLLDDPTAADAAREATEPLCPPGARTPDREVWLRAARLGPADPEIGRAVRACLAAAESALDEGGLRKAVGEFTERYAERGRCPADDRLDALTT